jgi:hypothetical protein
MFFPERAISSLKTVPVFTTSAASKTWSNKYPKPQEKRYHIVPERWKLGGVRIRAPNALLTCVNAQKRMSWFYLVCHRCPTTIVKMANSLISHNANREERALTQIDGKGPGVVIITQQSNPAAEATWITVKLN